MANPSLSSFASKLGITTSVPLTDAAVPVPEEDDEETKIVASPVSLVYGGDINAGQGTLHITTRRVIWTSSSQPQSALSLRYQQIVMHAISRDSSAFPQPSIYLQLDNGSEEMQEASEDEEDAEAGPLEAEVRFIPEDAGKVEDIFKALCDCAALNPDEEVEGEGDFYFDENEVLGGMDPEARAAMLAQQAAGMELEEGGEELGELIGEDPGRFEDEEEEEGLGDEGQHENGHMHS